MAASRHEMREILKRGMSGFGTLAASAVDYPNPGCAASIADFDVINRSAGVGQPPDPLNRAQKPDQGLSTLRRGVPCAQGRLNYRGFGRLSRLFRGRVASGFLSIGDE